MPSTFFSDLYDEAEQGAVKLAVPKGEYDFVVEEARPYAQSSMVFLTLKVLNGPQQGKLSEVNFVLPGDDAKRGARFYFVNRVQGFLAYNDVKAAFKSADGMQFEDGLQLIADTLVGKQVHGEVGFRTEGQYAGTNELVSTKPLAALQQQAQPQAAPAPQPVQQPQGPFPPQPQVAQGPFPPQNQNQGSVDPF